MINGTIQQEDITLVNIYTPNTGTSKYVAGVLNMCSVDCMWSRIAMNVAQHKILNLLYSSVFISVCVFTVWPKTTVLLPVWRRDAKSLDTPESKF